MNTCLCCGKYVLPGIVLTNGQTIHENCLTKIVRQNSDFKTALTSWSDYSNKIEKELNKSNNIKFKLLALISPHKSDINTKILRKALFEATQNVEQISTFLLRNEEIINSIYDFYPTYPPDWNQRKILIIELAGYKCSSCRSKNQLHLHHRVPLSMGGSNKLDNLVLLCEKCHSKAHGGRDLSKMQHERNTAFQGRLEKIHTAINSQSRLTFDYKKPSDSIYCKRIVRPPYKLEQVQHYNDSGSTLCLRAHCENRNSERVFALKRMRSLKLLL